MKEKVRSFLQREIDQNVTPGAVIRVRHKGKIILDEAVGTNSLEDDKVPMTSEPSVRYGVVDESDGDVARRPAIM